MPLKEVPMILWNKFAPATFMRRLHPCGEEGRVTPRCSMVLVAVLVGLLGVGAKQMKSAQSPNAADAATHSTTIALTSDETRVVVVNREANSVSVIQVKDRNG